MIKLLILIPVLIAGRPQTTEASDSLLTITQESHSAHGLASGVTLGSCKQRSSTPSGILVLLHGRGGHKNLLPLVSSFAKFICQRNLLLMAPIAPTTNNNWPFENQNGEKQDLYLLDLLQKKSAELFKTSEKQKIYLVGISAGATFLMGDFYPRHAFKLNGFAAALCGGSAPTLENVHGLRTVEAQFPLFVQISSKDFLFSQVESGLRRYEKLGLPLRAKITNEPGHCAFDFSKSLELIARKIQ